MSKGFMALLAAVTLGGSACKPSGPNVDSCTAGHFLGLQFSSPTKSPDVLARETATKFREMGADFIVQTKSVLVVIHVKSGDTADTAQVRGIKSFARDQSLVFEVEDGLNIDRSCKFTWDHPLPP
jgi:hypothetical protein